MCILSLVHTGKHKESNLEFSHSPKEKKKKQFILIFVHWRVKTAVPYMPEGRGSNDPRIQFVILIPSDMGPQAMPFLKVCKWCQDRHQMLKTRQGWHKKIKM